MERTKRSTFLTIVVPSFCAALILVILLAFRLERDAASYLRAGDEHYRRGEEAEAFFSWKLSISMYVPFSRTPREGAERLWQAGEEALRKGDPEEALRAFGYLRSGLLAIRHIRQPMPEMLARTEERMASLTPGEDLGERVRQLGVRHGTSSAGYPFLLIGVLGWPASVLFLFWRWVRGGAVWRVKALAPPLFFLAVLLAGVCLS